MGKYLTLLFLLFSISIVYSQCDNAPTVSISADNLTICEGEEINFKSTISDGSGQEFSYQWQLNNTSISGANTANLSMNSLKDSDKVGLKLTYICDENEKTLFSNVINIEVFQYPEVSQPQDFQICHGNTINVIKFEGSNSSAVYRWENSNTSIGLAASGTGNIQSFSAKNNSSQVQSATIKVTPTYNDCEGESKSFEITVFPEPAINSVENRTVCNGETIKTINFSGSTVSGTVYQWTNTNTDIGLSGSGNGRINSFTGINSTSSPITAEITIIPTANGCEGKAETFNITVNPTPTVNSVDDIVICNGETIDKILFTGSDVSETTYEWFNSNNAIGLSSSGNGPISAFEAINNSNAPITANIKVTPVANGCYGVEETFSIKVNPTPKVEAVENIVVCEGETVDMIKFTTAFTNTTVSWSNDNTSIGLSANGTGNISAFTAKNDSNESEISTIEITPTADNCGGISRTFTIEVKPKPETATIENKVFCNGMQTDEIILNGQPTGVKFDVTGGAEIGLNNRNNITAIPAFTPVNNSNQPKTVIIEVLPKANGCIGEIATFEITVNPTANVSISPASQQICTGSETSISLSGSVPDTQFSWIVSEISPAGSVQGASDGEGEEIQQSLRNETSAEAVVTYSVTPEANGCTGTPIKVKVAVNPLPILRITDPETVCAPAEIDLTNSSITAGSSANLEFSYWFDAKATQQLSNPEVAAAGVYYIKATNVSGCSTIASVTVSENPTPRLTSEKEVAGFCSENAFFYEFTSNIPETQFNWQRSEIPGISTPPNSDTGNIDEVLVNTTTNSIQVVYDVTLVSPDGCISSETLITTVTPTPLLTSTLSPGNICSGVEFSYSPQSNTSGTQFRWTRNAVSGITNPAASGTGAINEILENNTNQTLAVTYSYTLSSNNCENPQVYNITVPVTPSPNTVVSVSEDDTTPVKGSIEICEGGVVNLFSETSFPSNSNLPNELLNSTFNSNSGGWASTGNRSWSISNDGTVVDTQCGYIYVGPNWWNYEYRCEDIEIHSNDNSSFFLVNSNNSNGNFNNVSLVSPVFDTRGYSSLSLSFWHFYRDGGSSRNNYRDTGSIEYKIGNNGWRSLNNILYTSTEGEPNNFIQRTYDITSLIGNANVQIRFNYDGANSDYYWAVDNVSITGNGTAPPEVTWTANNSDWTSTEQNPKNIAPIQTTIYTATYVDPETGCPGSDSVEVIVKNPPQPKILADYCAYPNEPNKIKLYVQGTYDEYEWTSSGEIVGTGSSIDVTSAQGYTLRVWENGCEGSATIDISENLVQNGDFEQGNTGFNTQYGFRTDNPGVRNELYPEGLYAVDQNSNDYHNQFNDNGDHTTGDGNFMIVNGDPNLGNVVWETSGYLDVKPNTDYYFGAWTTNLVSRNEAEKYARLRLVVLTPGNNGQDRVSAESTLGDLRFQNVGEWIEFFNSQVWNSGNNTKVKLQIINENTIRDGNDFGIDDISFAEISAVEFQFEPSSDGPVCEDGTINLYANLEGGRDPITYSWTGPDNFTSSEANPVIENATLENSGIYELTITDFYGCANESKTTEVVVIPETFADAGEDFSICAETAEIQLNGVISGSIDTGTWSGGLGTFNPNSSKLDAIYIPSEAEIEAGFVELILSSAAPEAPCEPVSDTLNITINPRPIIEVTVTNNTCFGGNEAEAQVTVISGSVPITYTWSDGQTTATATGLSSGTYSVTARDANGCSVVSEITVLEPEPLEITTTNFVELSCFQSGDGFASIELAGGFMPEDAPQYEINILNEAGEIVREIISTTGIESFDDLEAGNYLFSVSTVYNCVTLTKAFTLTQPEEINIYAGDSQNFSTCGITTAEMTADPVDENLAMGSWEIIEGEGGSFDDRELANAVFTGLPNTTYSLQWTVTPLNGCPALTEIIEVQFAGGCSKLDYDGDNDYVSMGNNYELGTNFTIEAWVKPHSLNGTKTILSKRDAANPNAGGYSLVINNGKPSFEYNNKSVTSSFKIGTDRWYHIAVIANASEIRLYVDGVEVRTGAGGKPASIASPFLVGAAYNASTPANPENYFHGWIEEMRIWKTTLSEEQLRFMMNQRIQNNNALVRGEVLPMNVPGNLAWNNLDGYYRLISDQVKNGLTEDLAVNAIPGELRNIQTEQENSAPLPYILESNTNGEWFEKSTWNVPAVYDGRNITIRDVWDAPNSQSISPSEDIKWNIVILRGNVKNAATTNNKNSIELLGLLSDSGTLDMQGENNFSGNSLELSHYLKLDGEIDLNGESQLIQYENSILEESSKGVIEKDQQGTLNSFNYNYWTVPVSLTGKANNSGYTIAEVIKDGTDLSNARDISFSEQYTFADGNYSGALRISEYWLYIFNASANQYSAWEPIYATSNLKTGEGFSMKGTRGYAPIKDLQNYTFVGKPNNGSINLSISKGENRLIGNPYPSAIDATEFLRDNLKDIAGGRNSRNVFNGTLYFWDHFGKEDTHVLELYVGGYAALNLAGGVPGVSNDSRINANGNGGSKIPANYIPVGQGFFVNTVIDESTKYNFSVDGGDIIFTNSQRKFVRENPGRSQFLQQQKVEKTHNLAEISDDIRPKLRLKYESAEGYHRQILATGDVFASSEIDLGYDAPMIDINQEDMYWIIENSAFAIQGVSDFYASRTLPLGIRVHTEEEFKIKVDSLENWDPNIKVYLKDIVKDSIHDLGKSDFIGVSETGDIEERFEIIFKNERMKDPKIPIGDPSVLEIEYYSNTKNFMLKNPELLEISKIMIFDIGGKLLEEFQEIPIQKFFEFEMSRYAAGVYIIKVMDNSGESDKKFIVRN